MSLYTRARKHIDMNRVKELREEKIKKQKIDNLVERQLEIVAELKEIEKPVDWRRDLNEMMTTAGAGMINLPASGNVDLENVTKDATPGTDGSGGSGGSYSFGNYDETGNAGFTFRLDTTKYDTLKFSASGGNATKIELSINGGSFSTLSSGTNLINLSAANRASNILFVFNAEKSGGSGSSGASISGTAFQRRSPINLFVSLDDPEANAFIRMGDMNKLSAEERKKKLKDMLEAGNEYLSKYTNITPSKTSPGDIELTNVTSDARNPMGTGDQAALPIAVGLAASPMGQMVLAAGAAAVATLLGITIQKAQEVVNQANSMNVSGTDYGAGPGRETVGPSLGRGGIAGGRDLTPDQQAEVEAAADELRDARRALNDLPADATDAQKDMAQERLDRASKNRQRVRKKHKQENQ